jgi:hypothetical protein
VLAHISKDWGKYEMVIQPYLKSKSQKGAVIRYELYDKKVKACVVSGKYDINEIQHLDCKVEKGLNVVS